MTTQPPTGIRSRRPLGDALRPRPVSVTLALIALVLGAGLGAAVAGTGETSFASTVVLSVDQPLVVAAANDPGPIEKLNRLRLQYAALLRTAVVADDVARRAGVPARAVPGKVTAQAAQNSLLVVITARDPVGAAARRLAEASAQALIGYSQRSQEQAGVPDEQRVELSVVTPATAAQEETRAARTVATAALFAGLVLATFVYVIVSLLSARTRRR